MLLLENDNQIRSQFCTCCDSWAVVTCAKFWPDWIIRSIFTVKRIFIRFQLCAHELFVIWVLRHYQWTSSSNHIHGYCITSTWFCSNFDGPKFNNIPADSCLLRNVDIYLHFVSFPHDEFTKAAKIIALGKEGLVIRKKSTRLQFMTWWQKEPGHQ